ncbi:MAG: AraC family transcriptional regulator [Lentisphaerae bacterium]|nr:AraC family transcriptional regulator [Lentisphaerota bacterium]
MFDSGKYIRETGIIGPGCRERFVPLLPDGPLTGLAVGAAGVSELRSPYVMYRPRSSTSVVLGTLEGQGWLSTDEGDRTLRAGDLLIAPQGVNHHYETVRGRRWKIIWFNIGREIPCERVTVRTSRFLADLAGEFLDVMAEAAAGGFLHMEARMAKENYIAVMLQRILHEERRGAAIVHEERLRLLWRTVAADPARPWRLPELARLAGYSSEHLNRICRQRYGMPAVAHLTDLRMQHAAQLLGQGTHKLQAVAERCGYQNAFAFSVAFKRHFSLSPRKFLAVQRPQA